MIFKVFVSLQIVLIAEVFAESPTHDPQDQGNFKGYSPSGWRPSGPIFRLPEWPRLPQTTNDRPILNEDNLRYGPPQVTLENLNQNSGPVDQQNVTFQRRQNFTNTSFATGKNENQVDGLQSNGLNLEYGAPIGIQNNNRGGIENQIDLTYFPLQDTLSAPPNQPAVTYGPPQQETTTVPFTTELEFTTTELPTSTEIVTEEGENEKEESKEEVAQKEDLREDIENTDNNKGVYYIYHPSGLLQKVAYSTKDDQANMAYTAQLKYENVEPIKSPVYTYDPETFVFKRLY